MRLTLHWVCDEASGNKDGLLLAFGAIELQYSDDVSKNMKTSLE